MSPEGRHSEMTFTLNDKEFEHIQFPLPRADIAQVFWYKPGADKAAFQCRTSFNVQEDFKNGYASLKCVRRESGLPLREDYNWYYPDDREAPPLPDPERRRRVAGNDNAGLFRLEGYTTFKKLDLALRKAENKGLGEFQNILDWGCGCGRVTRYFYALPNVKLRGVDIDSDNLNWCRQN